MSRQDERGRLRRHPGVVVAGITVGILALITLQFAVLYLFGPWALPWT